MEVVAALRVAASLGPGATGATVATIIADSGLRYLSTDVYRDGAWHPAQAIPQWIDDRNCLSSGVCGSPKS